MKFCVNRTNRYDEQPCEEAVREDHGHYVDWVIEIETLEQLMAFQEKYGRIIISRVDDEDNCLKIEIYDNYRE